MKCPICHSPMQVNRTDTSWSRKQEKKAYTRTRYHCALHDTWVVTEVPKEVQTLTSAPHS